MLSVWRVSSQTLIYSGPFSTGMQFIKAKTSGALRKLSQCISQTSRRHNLLCEMQSVNKRLLVNKGSACGRCQSAQRRVTQCVNEHALSAFHVAEAFQLCRSAPSMLRCPWARLTRPRHVPCAEPSDWENWDCTICTWNLHLAQTWANCGPGPTCGPLSFSTQDGQTWNKTFISV